MNNPFYEFVHQESLTQEMADKFGLYLKELITWNKIINLTAITDEQRILWYHFSDSLAVRRYVDFLAIDGLADVGSGGGFPGIPLKICYPDLYVVLIEVNKKKIEFLQHIIELLGLEHIEIYDLDWRTFVRTTNFNIQLFCARASLSVTELLRMFRSHSLYRNEQLIYWASKTWQPTEKEKEFVASEQLYSVGNKQRKLVFLKNLKGHSE